MIRKSRFCNGERWAAFKSELRNVSFEEAKALIESEHPVILDVRTDKEQETDGIPGAIGMNYLDEGFIDRLLRLDRSKTYLVYCRTGRRSLRVCTWMKNSGFDQVYHLEHGFEFWESKD